jgi:DNA-binding NarL/FixJ family response regulator
MIQQNTPSKSLIVIDDHPVYREAIATRLAMDLKSFGVSVHSVGSAGDAIDMIQASNQRWVVLLDILMPGLSGTLSVKAFKQMDKVEHVVAISSLDEKQWEKKCLSAGATFFISKSSTSESISHKLVELFQDFVPTPHNPKETDDVWRLTRRQIEVLELIAKGHSNKMISNLLEISEQTVKIHINQIFKELKVFNRTQAALKAQKIFVEHSLPSAYDDE